MWGAKPDLCVNPDYKKKMLEYSESQFVPADHSGCLWFSMSSPEGISNLDVSLVNERQGNGRRGSGQMNLVILLEERDIRMHGMEKVKLVKAVIMCLAT